MDLGLSEKVALVTGSTSGLGLASAKALAAEGAAVTICGRRGNLARERAAELPRAIGVEADLTDPAAPEALVSATAEAFGRVDILVGSTGGPPPGTVLDLPAEAYEEAVALLLTPMVRLARLVLPGMRERGWGRLVFVTSAAVREPIPFLALSNAVRMSVHGFAKSLSRQVAPDGVTVNCVLPGRIATDRIDSLDRAAADASGKNLEEIRAANKKAVPAGRYGDPDEFGAVVAFLCSQAAAYVTGASVPVDGGALVSHW